MTTSKNSKDKEDLVQLYNVGWQRGAVVPRLEKTEGGKFKIQLFNAFCPKVFGSIGGLRGALQDRTIQIVMTKPNRKDKRGDLWPEENQEVKDIRNNLYPFALENWGQVYAYYRGQEKIQIEKEFKLNNRDWQIWQPLICIAKMIDGELYDKIGKFAEELTNIKGAADGLEEDTWQYKICVALQELANLADDFVEITVVGIKNNMTFAEKEKKPTNSFVGKYINKIGFRKYRKRGNPNYYFVNKKIVDEILTNQNLVTQVTQVTQVTPSIEEEEIK